MHIQHFLKLYTYIIKIIIETLFNYKCMFKTLFFSIYYRLTRLMLRIKTPALRISLLLFYPVNNLWFNRVESVYKE